LLGFVKRKCNLFSRFIDSMRMPFRALLSAESVILSTSQPGFLAEAQQFPALPGAFFPPQPAGRGKGKAQTSGLATAGLW
jgi:hypothetical protein